LRVGYFYDELPRLPFLCLLLVEIESVEYADDGIVRRFRRVGVGEAFTTPGFCEDFEHVKFIIVL
jgi:hypothetical protein